MWWCANAETTCIDEHLVAHLPWAHAVRRGLFEEIQERVTGEIRWKKLWPHKASIQNSCPHVRTVALLEDVGAGSHWRRKWGRFKRILCFGCSGETVRFRTRVLMQNLTVLVPTTSPQNLQWEFKTHPVYIGPWSLCWARTILSPTSRSTSRKSNLISYCQLRLDFPEGLIPLGFPTKPLYTVLSLYLYYSLYISMRLFRLLLYTLIKSIYYIYTNLNLPNYLIYPNLLILLPYSLGYHGLIRVRG